MNRLYISLTLGIAVVLGLIVRLPAQSTLPPAKQAIEQQYAQERAAGTNNPAPPDPNASYPVVQPSPFQTGISDDCDGFDGMITANCWGSLVNGVETKVYAGVETDEFDPQQGLVKYMHPGAPETILTPVRAGAVKIIAAQNSILTLVSAQGPYVLTFDSNTGQFTSVVLCGSPSITVNPTTGQYSDVVRLAADVTNLFCPGGTVSFSVNGFVVGTAHVDTNGTATLAYTIPLVQGTYPLIANYTNGTVSSSATNSLVVTLEDAIVTPSSSNPLAVKVTLPGGTAGSITLVSSINEFADGSLGNISLAVPVTVTLTPVGTGSTFTKTCSTIGGGVGGILTATCTFSNLPVNVYDVATSVGGNYYHGGANTVMAVYDPSLGFLAGGGLIMHNRYPADFGFTAKYLKSGQIQGSILYIEHGPAGDQKLKSNAMQSLSIVNQTGILLAKATLNGGGGYSFRATAVDNGEPGTSDQFGLQVTDPNNAIVPDLTFLPIALSGGNIQVPHK